jgi:LPS-assembly protein
MAALLLAVADSAMAASETANSNTQSTLVTLTPNQVAAVLGWVPEPNEPTLCHGYYEDQPITLPINVPANATTIAGQEGIFVRDQPSILRGNVIITQQGRQVTGNEAQSIPNSKTHQTETLNIQGDVHLRQPGALMRGAKAQVNLQNNSAWIENAVFRYKPIGISPEPVYDQQRQPTLLEIRGTNYRGTAQKFEQEKPKLINLDHVTITSCNPYSKAWILSADNIKLDQTEGTGTAYNTWISIQGIPVFYTPYLRFPIDNRRKTGFLLPIFSFSDISGWGVGTPFYWNMAPNYDMTATPIYYTNRGTQYNDLFRYLTWKSSGQMYFSALPGDEVFSKFKDQYGNSTGTAEQQKLAATSDNRYQFAWQDNTQYTPSWSSQVQFDYTNDDYYILDFGDAPMFSNSNPLVALLPNTQLSQMISSTYASDHWSLSGLLQNFETLHPVTLSTQQDQYSRLPQINLIGSYPREFLNLDYHLSTQFTDFEKPLWEFNYPTNVYPVPSSIFPPPPPGTAVTGQRYDAQPSIDLPLTTVWGYIKPQVTFEGTQYELAVPPSITTQKKQIGRAIPIYDIDSGLYFDRDITIRKEELTQTFEPRLFYLNVPYVDQYGLPIFDTSLNPIATYDQLFSTNQFTGIDRIQNANQVTAGITTRFIKSDTGYDLLDASIGEIYYFENRKVWLSNTPPVATDPLLQTNSAKLSPINGQINWQFRRFWNATGNVAYDPINRYVQNSNIALTFDADNSHIISASYGFVKNGDPFPGLPPNSNSTQNNFQQFSLGTSWPLNYQWHFLVDGNYNVSHHYFQTYFYGLEYHSCCWAIRLLNSRTYQGFQPNNSAAPLYDNQIYLQFTLTGLSSIGNSSPTSLLQYGLPGYQDTFGQQSMLNSF